MRKCSLCVVAGVSISDRKGEKKKKRNEGERNRKGVEEAKEGGREEDMERDEKERESRSREVLCLWKRGKHGDKGHRRRIRPWGRRRD